MNGATLTIGEGSLNIDTDFICYGQYASNNSAGNVYIGGDLIFEDGATANVTANSEIYIDGDMEFRSGSNVNMTAGYIEFQGASNSFIRTYTPATIYHLRSDKNDTYYVNFSNLSSAVLTIGGTIYVYDGSKISQGYIGTVILKGNLNVYTGGICTFGSGTLSMEGTTASTIGFADVGNYLKNLRINKTGSYVTVNSNNLQVNGNFTIDSGQFLAQSYTIRVGGNWDNNVGLAAFSESSSTIVLNGSGNQTISSEDFYMLNLNKSAGNMLIPTGSTVNCATYKWTAGAYTVSGGTFTADDLEDPGIMGVITLSSGTINYHQDVSQFLDLRADLTISNGTFNVHGGNSDCWWSYVDTATLTMSGGILKFFNQGIYISSSYSFNDAISGGEIITIGGFNVSRSDFNPTGGTITLYGPYNCNLLNTAGSNFFNIKISKTSATEEGESSLLEYRLDRAGNQIPITRSNTVTGSGPLDINGYFNIDAGTFIAPETMNVAGNWQNEIGPEAFTEGTGTVVMDGSGHQYCNYDESFNILNINKSGGALRINNAAADVTCMSYIWSAGAVDLNVGTFTAQDLAQNGIYGAFYVNPGAVINLHQGTDQWIDLNALLNFNGGGTINIYGGSLSSYWANSSDATINMTDGELNFMDRGVVINSSVYALNLTITGGVIRTVGGLSDNRGGVVFAGGEWEFNGSGDYTVSLNTGSRFFNVKVNKTGTTRGGLSDVVQVISSHGRTETIDMRANSIAAGSDLQINGALTILAGTFNVGNHTVLTYYPLHIYGTLRMNDPAGVVNVWDDINWYASSSSNVTAGTIYCRWNWLFQNGCTVDLTGSTVRMNSDYGATLTNQSPTAQFGNLEIYATEEDPETTYNYSGTCVLMVNGDLTIYPTNTLNLNEGLCTVTGNTLVQETGIIEVGDGGTFTVGGNLDLHGAMVTGPGTAIIHGDVTTYSTSSINVDQGMFKCDAPWAAPYVLNLAGAVNINNGVFELTHRTLTVQAHATRIWNNATVRVGVGFIAAQVDCFKPTGTGGGLYMIGINSPVLEASNGNWLTNLYIQKDSSTNTVFLQDDIIIKRNLTLSSGKLNANDYDITISGDWSNNVGSGAFIPGEGTVYFNKSSALQSINGSNNFHNVTDDHLGAALTFMGTTGISGSLIVNNIVTFQSAATLGTVTNDSPSGIMAFYNAFTSNIASYSGFGALRSYTNSHVIIADLVLNGIYGEVIADSGHLEFHQDTGNWIDLNSDTYIVNNGIIDIYGGNMSCYIGYSANASLMMTSGEFNIKNWGLSSTASSYTGSFNIIGGTITCNGNFSDWRGNFNPTGGTVKLEGSMDATISLTAPSAFHNLLINKVVTRNSNEMMLEASHDGSTTPVTREGGVNLNCDNYFTINGDFTIQAANIVYLSNHLQVNNAGTVTINAGTMNLENYIMLTTGNIDIYGTLQLPPSSILKLAAGKSLNVLNGGHFESVANLANFCTVTRNGASGNYIFNVESGGTISSYNTIFEYMGTHGVNVKSGAMVDPANSFTYCTFQNGASGGALLSLNNSQTLSINNAYFPANTWSGSYNVIKTNNQGQVIFTDYTGDFSGTAFEHDPYNRITWFVAGIPAITDLHIEPIGVSDIRLWWNYSEPFDQFKIYASDRPEGPFIMIGTSATTQWTGSSSLSKAFYQVSVEYEP